MRKNIGVIILSLLFILLNSCTSKKKLDYLQNIESVALEASMKNAAFILNDVDEDYFGYGNKYGYGYSAKEKTFLEKLRDKF